MADFCWQCTEELGARGEQNDFFVPLNLRVEMLELDRVLCEGCGKFVTVDTDGRCQEHDKCEAAYQADLTGQLSPFDGGF